MGASKLKIRNSKKTINIPKKIQEKENRASLIWKLFKKKLESKLDTQENVQQHKTCKKELIYNHIAEGIRVRGKWGSYENGEKSTKFFLNLERKRGVQNNICKLIFDEKDIVNPKKMTQKIYSYYETLFREQ